ncbi:MULTISPECIES: hypothetical protein [unclassified Paenibacillus]|uniref:HesB/YadR/YfhF family protein n=1 Tax=unclassified Paenibacillus TaxID=185978 RepID=UPI000953A91B|nr:MULTISPECIES: hypothetical protein [unclassified Paenibacillus]ASS66890.1 hypothetical protein CIC07_12630 [Paenibacillus sp. RUD330]SIR52712.1 Uncharacterized protein YneR [Paenibacillus sp. RU4X]SIR61601.1 Uncharacterized protein YneR [Paenibacillus sp. RU4T]
MKLTVDPEAARWYKEELNLQEGDQLRVFVRLGGCGSVQPGLSLGIMKDESRRPGLRQEEEGLVFFMEEDQLWYLDGKELHLRYDSAQDEAFMDVY